MRFALSALDSRLTRLSMINHLYFTIKNVNCSALFQISNVVKLTLNQMRRYLTKPHMFNENNARRADINSGFVLDHETSDHFELILPEPVSTMDEPFDATDFESDDFFMELEFEFDE